MPDDAQDASAELQQMLLTCPVKSIVWEATVIRANGDVEDLGVIAENHNPSADFAPAFLSPFAAARNLFAALGGYSL